MKSLAFSEFAEFLYDWSRLPRKRQILPEMQFERDLGITGDDGCDLMMAVEKKFGISLSSGEEGYRRTFDLGPNEYLFHSEGFGFVAAVITLFSSSTVHAFTVGELYEAVKQAVEARKG